VFGLKDRCPAAGQIAEAEGADQHPRDKYGNAPLHDVARRGLLEVAEVLIEEGGPFSPSFSVIFNRKCLFPCILIRKCLFPCILGHDVNLENGMADRALHMSAASGQLAMTKLLVEHGAEIDPQTSWGMTPL